MTRDFGALTLQRLQESQPWTVPYSTAFKNALEERGTGHLMGTHATLHAMKTAGQIAAVFENLDHSGRPITDAQTAEIAAKSADLVTAALRLANLYGFDLTKVLVERSEEKNNVTLSWAGE